LNAETEHDAAIEPGGKGQFDVVVENDVVFSKQEAGRFPEHAEIRALLAA
jgi:predicted Rdx family selenoprotein